MQVLTLPDEGPLIATDRDATDIIGEAFSVEANLVVIPVSRLSPEFFQLRSGIAGNIVQKFVNYRLRLAIIGDITAEVEASTALRDFVYESNRGKQLWFLPTAADLEDRLKSASPFAPYRTLGKDPPEQSR
jgi:hypothetical protein